MLDPSLFLSFRTLRLIREAFDAGELKGALVPRSFVSSVQQGTFLRSGLRYFGASQKEIAELRNVGSFIGELERYKRYEPPAEGLVSGDMREELETLAPDLDVFEILSEEWLFLNSQSWLASRTRKAFSTFVRAGALAAEGGRKLFDEVAMRTLKLSPEIVPFGLTRGHRLRAASKWIAVGGASAVSLLPTGSGVLAGAAIGYFLLFDP